MSNFYLRNRCLAHIFKNSNLINSKRSFFNWYKKTKPEGYYILFPDIPSDTPQTNHLLELPTNDSTPQFSKLTPEKCIRAVAKLSIDFESCIDTIDNQLDEKKLDISFDEIIKPIEEHLIRLDFGLSTLRALRTVNRSRYDFRHFDQFFDRINGVKVKRFESQRIYYFMREINSNKNKVNNQQKRVADKYLLESKLFGTNLPSNEKINLDQIHKKLNKEKTEYQNKLTEATKRFTHTIDDPSLLQVLPDELIASIGSHSNATVTLHSSVFNPFMEYCPDRDLRWNLWMAYNSRASPANDPNLSNSINIEQIRGLRRKQAQLFGYDSYVDLSMETKMAHNLENVKAFITTLHIKSKPSFDANLKELSDFAHQSGSFEGDKLELWDVPYWQRKLLKTKYSIEDMAIKQYFPLDSVLKGMFELTEGLFGIRIEEVDSCEFDPWHKDVRLFRILSEKDGIVGSFFFDPYSRFNEKMGSHNEFSLVRCPSLKTKPISYLIANLPKPLFKGQSTQLSFAQILGLFKQFGPVLQHSLSQIQYSEISGLSNLEWDVAHFMPEFFSLWPLNSYKVIASCSRHVVDGSQLPEEAFHNIKSAHYHFSSINLKHEIYRMALDLALYSNTEFWAQIKDQIWDQYMSPFSRERLDTHPCSFRAIFSGNFAAAYFSFKWAEMLASDAFGAFQEVGLENDKEIKQVGLRFRDTFLSLSGGYNTNEIFRRFLGRDPSVDAFLKVNGLSAHLKKDHSLGHEKSSEVSSERHNS